MNKEQIKEIQSSIVEEIKLVNTLDELNEIKNKYLSKKGIITELSSNMKNIPNEEKKEYGMIINEVRNTFNNLYEEKLSLLEEQKLNEKLQEQEKKEELGRFK